jgi:hypothetical protein
VGVMPRQGEVGVVKVIAADRLGFTPSHPSPIKGEGRTTPIPPPSRGRAELKVRDV